MPTHMTSLQPETLVQHRMHSRPFFPLYRLFRASSEKRPSCQLQKIGVRRRWVYRLESSNMFLGVERAVFYL